MCVWFESSEFDYIFLVDFDVRRTRRIESDGGKAKCQHFTKVANENISYELRRTGQVRVAVVKPSGSL